MGALSAGATTVIAVDVHPERLEAARSMGATHVVGAGENAVAAIRGATEGRGADYVFEAVGDPKLQELCLEATRPGGSVVLSGIAPMGSGTNFPGAILTRQEKTVMGSYYGTANPGVDFPLYAEMYSDGKLPLDRLVTQRYRLEQINEAYDDMLRGRGARGVVVFD
jgi:Zn-dependent alcohol dehydrogenase